MPRLRFSRFLMALGFFLAIYLLHTLFTELDEPGRTEGTDKGRLATWMGKSVMLNSGLSKSLCGSSGAEHLPEFGGGCFLRDKLTCSGLPTIHSAFLEIARDEVVFVGVKHRDDAWDAETYICEFPNGEMTLTDPVVKDYRSFGNGYPQYLIVISCPVPRGMMAQSYYRRVNRFTVNFRSASDPQYAYTSIPVCLTDTKQRFLSLCTMVKDVTNFIPDWLFYYKQLGVEHVYMYDNDPKTTMPDDLEDYVSTGFLTLIPWAHTPSSDKTYLEVQIAHENDCLWRHRHNTKWMLKVDVDEFVQPMDPERRKISDYLAEPRLDPMATVRLRNWFFGRPLNARKNIVGAKTVLERNPWRVPEATLGNVGRDKCIVRPINVHYFKIHAAKIGGDTMTFDPEKELRLVHYRRDNPRHRGFQMKHLVKDNSMVDLWRKMTAGQAAVSPALFMSDLQLNPSYL